MTRLEGNKKVDAWFVNHDRPLRDS